MLDVIFGDRHPTVIYDKLGICYNHLLQKEASLMKGKSYTYLWVKRISVRKITGNYFTLVT